MSGSESVSAGPHSAGWGERRATDDDPARLVDDPLARWRWLNARREAAIGAIRARREDTADYWTTRAAAFGQQLRHNPAQPPPALDLLAREIDGATTLLDVGAGAGRLALPLAGRARLVTAVEPNAILRGYLEEDASAAGLFPARLRTVAATWEEAAVEPADLVVCANVLPPIPDAGAFLRKLAAHARRRCYVIVRATPLDAPLVALWRAVHGAPYPRETTHVDACDVLHALGILAQVTILPGPPGRIWTFETPEAATRMVRDRLWLGPPGADPRADALVQEWVGSTLAPDGDRWRIPAPPQASAVLWWDVAASAQ